MRFIHALNGRFELRKNSYALYSIICVLLFCVFFQSAHAQILTGKMDYVSKNNELIITGTGFGEKCARCEIIGHYANINYSLPILSWNDQKIRARIPVLGSDLSAIAIQSENGIATVPKSIKYEPEISPVNSIGKLVRPRDYPSMLIEEYQSKSNLGDKGLHTYNVSVPEPTCGVVGSRFSRAEIVLGKRTRFARTAIVQKPSGPCYRCKPIKVKYFVEPTGHLHYQLHIYRERVEGICPNRVRN